MRKMVFLTAVMFMVACDGKKDEERIAPPQTAPATGSAIGGTAPPPTTQPAGSAAAPAPSTGKLDCDKILGKDLRERYFTGKPLVDSPQPGPEKGACVVRSDAGLEVMISADCPATRGPELDGYLATMKETRKELKDLPGVGKAAVIGPAPAPQQASTIVYATDDDSTCRTEVMVPATLDAAAITRDFLAQLPPK